MEKVRKTERRQSKEAGTNDFKDFHSLKKSVHKSESSGLPALKDTYVSYTCLDVLITLPLGYL